MKRTGEELGGYVVAGWLGSGGMGTVYDAVDAEGRHVALKLLHPHLGVDPVARARLRREVETLQRVRHPGVARVLDSETDSDEAFVVTELIHGVTLDAHVRDQGPLPLPDVAELGRGLMAALRATHEAGVVHRDIKPANVMLTAAGPVLIDFGISQVVDAERYTQIGLVTGTAGYLDPRVVAGEAPDRAADWWSWVGVLAFAATGRPPFGSGPPAAVLARASGGDADLTGLPTPVATAFRAALRPSGHRLAPADLLAVLDGSPAGMAALARLAPPRQAAPSGTRVLPSQPPPSAPSAQPPVVPPPSYPPADPYRAPAAGPYRSSSEEPYRSPTADPYRGPDPYRTQAVPPSAAPHAPPPYRSVPPTQAGAAYEAGARYQPGAGYSQPTPQQSGPYQSAPYQPAPYRPDAGQAPGWLPGAPPVAVPSAPPRPGVLFVLWVLLGALAASWPGVVLVFVLLLMVLTGSFGSGVRTVRRRLWQGKGRNRAVVWLLTPWHLLRAVLVLLPAAVVGVLAGAAVWWGVGLAMTGAVVGASGLDGTLEAAATAGTVAAAVGAAWLIPFSGLPREGARHMLALLLPGRTGRVLVVVVGLAVALVLGALAALGLSAPDWWPLPEPPA